MNKYIAKGDHSYMEKFVLSCHFKMGNNFGDSLFVSLDKEAFLKLGLLLKKRICSIGANSFLQGFDPYPEGSCFLKRVSINVNLRLK